jgi:hypothetical protein
MKKASPSLGGGQHGLQIREVEAVDLDNGFLEALENLSDTGRLSPGEARKVLAAMKRSSDRRIFVGVMDGVQVGGTTTLLLDKKFIHR